jgi:WD40 repeat protein
VKSVVSNGTHVFSVASDTSAALRDARTMALVAEFRHGHTKIANGAAVLPDGRFASVSRDRILRLWTASGSTEIATPHQRSIKCVAVSHDGRSIATGAYDGRIAVYDLAADRWTVTRLTISGISSITPFHDGFIASSYDGRTYEAGA